MAAGLNPVVDFGPFHLHMIDRKLLFGTEEVRVGGRGMEILLALAARQGEVVGKRELMRAGWPETFVHESNLKVTIAQLRRALRYHSPAGEFINTVVGRGYWLGDGVGAPGSDLLASAAHEAGSLPQRSEIVGREAEVALLEESFTSHRLLTIVGPGGIGKTALATTFAHKVAARNGCTVKFVDLSRIKGEEYVAASLAAALGITSGNDSLQAIYSILSRQRMLLVIDTCEHVLQAVSHVCDVLLSRTEHLCILATSREVLRARGEKLLWLSPLPIPPADDFDNVDSVLRFAAPKLLAIRASETGPFAPNDHDARALVQICREVDGSPLAIELVAPRLASLGAEAALGELEHGLMALRRRDRQGPRRQQTLANTLRWSYSLLSTQEAATLRGLSVFAGEFNADAAVQVAGSPTLSALEVIDSLSSLRSKSMISVELHDAEPHYRLLDSTREFAEGLLDRLGERVPLYSSHARWVSQRLLRSGDEQATVPSRLWRARYGPLIDDFRKSIEWTLLRSADPLLGIRIVAAGLPLLHELSLNGEIRSLCERALSEFRRLGCKDDALELQLAVGLAAVSTYLATDPDRATPAFQYAVELARRTGNAPAECRALGAYATYELLRGRSEPVLKALTAMREAALRTRHPAALWEEEQLRAQYEIRICSFDAAIARVHRLAAEMQGKAEHAVPSFQIHQRLNVEIQLAALNWLTGRYRAAVDLAGLAAEHARAAEHGLTIVHCLAQGVVWTLFQCGEYKAVLPHIEALREAIYRHGIAAWVPVADTYAVAVDSYLGGKPDPARLRSAFYGVRAGVAQIRHDARYALIADAMIANDQADDAAEVIAHALGSSAEPWCRSEFLRLQAAVERRRGYTDEALRSLRSAFDAAKNSGSIAWTLRAATDLAAMLRTHGNAKEAVEILNPACKRFAGELETRDLLNARAVLAQLT